MSDQDGFPRPSRRDLLIGGAMLTAGGVAYARLPHDRTILIGPKQLEKTVPLEVGPWVFQTASGLVEPPPDELANLLYDQQVSRYYAANDGQLPVMLSMAYGSSQGGVLQVHRPEICYPASGFRLSDTQTRALTIAPGTTIPVRFFHAVSDTREEQVLYWTRVGDMLPTSWTSQRIAIMRSNLAGNVPDGLLVRLSTIAPTEAMAWETLTGFARMMLEKAGRKGRQELLGGVYGRA
jgi:EpsI family protein